MTAEPQTHSFQAETRELLDLMIHSLYSHREIFLRELISNASDALDKLRFEALTERSLLEGSERLAIRLEVEPAGRILRVIDNGIGMRPEELVDNLGTIARSGTRRFLEAAANAKQEAHKDSSSELPELIGQFGVGFYASFMVAEKIVVETRRAGDQQASRWTSTGDGTFTVEELPSAPRGTSITLHLKAEALEPTPEAGAGEDAEAALDLLSPAALRGLVQRYSDFVEYPIEMAKAHFVDEDELEPVQASDGLLVVVLNSMKPLWERPKDQITPEEYAQFFKHLTHSWSDPLETVHFKAEGTAEYAALLYVPGERPLDLFDPGREKARLSLYVKRVFVMADCEELLPGWLRFVRGVVDSKDLPLNVSREILQHNRQLGQIGKRLVKKLMDALAAMLAERREDYQRFWQAFGSILKEGLVIDPERQAEIAKLCLFQTSRDEELSTLDEVLARLPEGQQKLYCLYGSERSALEQSPHLETALAQGFEVLFLTDPVDEWVLERLREYEERPIERLDRGQLELDGEAAKEVREQAEREFRDVLERLESHLKSQVEKVRFSSRLKESPAVLVDEGPALGPTMERMLRQSGQEPPRRQRVLELNPGHPVVARLKELGQSDEGGRRVDEFGELLYGQALLAEGSPLPDPARFGRLVNDLMLGG